MKLKALANIKYQGKRYPPGSIFALKKGDENLSLSQLVEVIPDEKTEVSSDKERRDNSDGDDSQRSRKAARNKGGDDNRGFTV